MKYIYIVFGDIVFGVFIYYIFKIFINSETVLKAIVGVGILIIYPLVLLWLYHQWKHKNDTSK
jgi:hypothetical protein